MPPTGVQFIDGLRREWSAGTLSRDDALHRLLPWEDDAGSRSQEELEAAWALRQELESASVEAAPSLADGPVTARADEVEPTNTDTQVAALQAKVEDAAQALQESLDLESKLRACDRIREGLDNISLLRPDDPTVTDMVEWCRQTRDELQALLAQRAALTSDVARLAASGRSGNGVAAGNIDLDLVEKSKAQLINLSDTQLSKDDVGLRRAARDLTSTLEGYLTSKLLPGAAPSREEVAEYEKALRLAKQAPEAISAAKAKTYGDRLTSAQAELISTNSGSAPLVSALPVTLAPSPQPRPAEGLAHGTSGMASALSASGNNQPGGTNKMDEQTPQSPQPPQSPPSSPPPGNRPPPPPPRPPQGYGSGLGFGSTPQQPQPQPTQPVSPQSTPAAPPYQASPPPVSPAPAGDYSEQSSYTQQPTSSPEPYGYGQQAQVQPTYDQQQSTYAYPPQQAQGQYYQPYPAARSGPPMWAWLAGGGTLLALIIGTIVLVLVLGGGGQGSPKSAAAAFWNYIFSGNYEAAVDLLAPDQVGNNRQQMIDQLRTGMGRVLNQNPNVKATVQATSETVTGDTATVQLSFKSTDGKKAAATAALKKVNNKWYVTYPGMPVETP